MAEPRTGSLVADYLSALQNEVYFDERFARLAGLNMGDGLRLPRPARWFAVAKRHRVAFRIAAALAWLAWWLGGALVFFSFVALREAWRTRAAPPAMLGEHVLLACNAHAVGVVHAAFPDRTFQLLADAAIGAPSGRPWCSARQVVGVRGVVAAWRLSLCTLVALLRHGRARQGLQAYTAFPWYLHALALETLGGALYTAEHFDRWALLADRCARRTLVTMVQHGTLLDGGVPVTLDLPVRIANVRRLVTYDAAEANAFLAQVFVPGAQVECTLMARDFRTSPLPGDDRRPSVLVIGHALCEPFQLTLLVPWLLERARVLYKPHPTTPPGRAAQQASWETWPDVTQYPRVDIVVSYPSTLAQDYQRTGARVVMHPIGADASATQGVLDALSEALHDVERGRPPDAGV